MELSIVATVYNDAEIVPILVDRIIQSVAPLNVAYEIILINDCSPDGSEFAIAEQSKKHTFVKGISLSRNCGQQIAMSAGIHQAKGNYVLIMDGDLQNPPEDIPRLYEKIKEGYDLVYAVSTVRNGWTEELSSKFFWYFVSRILKVKVIPNQLMMKMMTQKFVQQFNTYSETNRTISGIVADIGSKCVTVPVENHRRTIGKTNYNFFKRFNLMIDIIISFSNAPLNFIIYLGMLIFVATTIGAAREFYVSFVYGGPEGYLSLRLTQFFFGSINILSLGLIGRYLSSIYAEVKRRPLYIIDKTYNI